MRFLWPLNDHSIIMDVEHDLEITIVGLECMTLLYLKDLRLAMNLDTIPTSAFDLDFFAVEAAHGWLVRCDDMDS